MILKVFREHLDYTAQYLQVLFLGRRAAAAFRGRFSGRGCLLNIFSGRGRR